MQCWPVDLNWTSSCFRKLRILHCRFHYILLSNRSFIHRLTFDNLMWPNGTVWCHRFRSALDQLGCQAITRSNGDISSTGPFKTIKKQILTKNKKIFNSGVFVNVASKVVAIFVEKIVSFHIPDAVGWERIVLQMILRQLLLNLDCVLHSILPSVHAAYRPCAKVTINILIKLYIMVLTHLPLDKMAAISQMIFSNAFSWMKKILFWIDFHWSLFLMPGVH